MRQRVLRGLVLSLVLAFAASGAALAAKAPEDPVEKRFKDIEKQVRQLRSIVTQARDTGQPVQVRVTNEPDPVLEALGTRLDDLEQAARTRNEQIDTLAHDLDLARKDAADARSEARGLQERLTRVEARLKTIDDNAAAAAAAAPAAAAPPASPQPYSAAAAPAPAAVQPAQDADSAFRTARQLLDEGQYPAAGAAFQDFVETYGDTPNGPEARYWLGETLYIRGMYADAAAAYIGSIRGWPQTGWAPDAVVKLSRTLVAMNKQPDACRALDELDRRYPNRGNQVRLRANSVRTAAACPAPAAAAPAPAATPPRAARPRQP